ncbi:hypothetical protein [Acetobacter papayae]|uniref:hypothetical protein n=1 Tax=Acetobacter papayae TaxID=1076592 RepID=UPI00046FD7DE|nr:hypothetical protein [Acetobacter papayae]
MTGRPVLEKGFAGHGGYAMLDRRANENTRLFRYLYELAAPVREGVHGAGDKAEIVRSGAGQGA